MEGNVEGLKETKRKPVIFVATDSPAVNTGFGKVCRELVTRWASTGKYTIVCMGVNDKGEWHPIRTNPNIIIEPLPFISEDPYGLHRMPELLKKYQPDLIFGLNDIWVWTADERHPQMDNWFYKHIKNYKNYVPFVGYFPLDANLWDQKWVALANAMDYSCTFTDYGKKILSETRGYDTSKLKIVYHGHDHEHFFPISDEEKKAQRKAMGIPEDYFVVTCFRAGTPVLMKDFSEKNIEDIEIGDEVINHKGEADTVTDTMSRIYEGKLYTLEVAGLPTPVSATDEHPFYAVQNVKTKLDEKEWVEIKNLKDGDYLACPVIKDFVDVEYIETIKLNDNCKVSAKSLPDIYVYDNYIYRKIKNITSKFIIDKVYNISVENEESYIACMNSVHNCINRNQPRKNIPATMYAFEMFHKGYSTCNNCGFPISLRVFSECELCGCKEFTKQWDGVEKALLYLHMNPIDARGYRLPKIQRDLKIKNVLYPMNFDVAKGVPIEELNRIYNMSDVCVNSASSGGYELTISEALACGKPVITTRTTCLTEQLADGRGILVPPITYHIYEDACQSPKHLISIPELIKAFIEVYQNQEKYNSPEVVKNRIDFAKSRSWGKAADQFMEMFDSLLENRLNLSSYLDDKKDNLILVNNSANLGNIISMLPAVKALNANYRNNINVMLAVRDRFHGIVSKAVDCKVLDLEKVWFDNENISQKVKIEQVEEFATQRERAGMVLGPDYVPNYADAYAQGFNVTFSKSDLNNIINPTKESKELANSIISSLNKSEEDYIFTFVMDFVSPEEFINPEAFKSSVKLLKRKPNIKTLLLANKDQDQNFEEVDLEVKDLQLDEIFALCEKSDCIITNIEEFSHISSFIQKPFILINTNKDLKHTTKYNKTGNVQFITARRTGKNRFFELGQADIFANCVRMYNTLKALKEPEKSKE